MMMTTMMMTTNYDDDDSSYSPYALRSPHFSTFIKDGLKQPHCNKLLTKTRLVVAKLRSPNVLALLEKREKKTNA